MGGMIGDEMGHISNAKRREIQKIKDRNRCVQDLKRGSLSSPVCFWCPQYDEVVEGTVVSIESGVVTILYLGGPVTRLVSEFRDSRDEDRVCWWPKFKGRQGG